MGALTTLLQDGFEHYCPAGWRARREVGLLSAERERFLGFGPRVDVLLERIDGSRRIWVEFEVSRADPVANHAKFATAHLWQPQPETDGFVSMVSSHVMRGRRNLGAAMIAVMRRLGMDACQTVLFPSLGGDAIRRLNHLDLLTLRNEAPPVEPEIARVFAVTERRGTKEGLEIQLAGELLEVLRNASRWNEDLESAEGRLAWGRRTITYFVHDPWTGLFAPSKFCAYIPSPSRRSGPTMPQPDGGMTVALYARIDQETPVFDGHRARNHLVMDLGMLEIRSGGAPDLTRRFESWRSGISDAVTVHPEGPVFILPPVWLR